MDNLEKLRNSIEYEIKKIDYEKDLKKLWKKEGLSDSELYKLCVLTYQRSLLPKIIGKIDKLRDVNAKKGVQK